MSQASTMIYRTPSRHLRPNHVSSSLHDSPSRQLLGDLELELDKLHVYEQDVQKIHLFERDAQQSTLDNYDAKVASKQLAELDAAVARNEAIRKEAEAELFNWRRQVAEEQRRRDAEALRIQQEELRRKTEEQRRAREDAERRAADERARIIMERQEAEKKAREAAEQKAQTEAEESSRRERDHLAKREADEKAQAEAEAKAKVQQAKVQKEKVEAAKVTQVPSSSPSSEKERRHSRYLEIHQALKSFRKNFVAESKKDPNLKTKSGDIRRKLRQYVGQLVDLKTGNHSEPKEAQELKSSNLKVAKSIQTLMKEAMSMPSSPVHIRNFIAFPPPNVESAQVSALMIYAFNMLSKRLVEQWATEAAIATSRAEAIGVVAAKIFSAPEFLLGGVSMVDILLAKLHAACPVLFGLFGSENTKQGRLRLGWKQQQGSFIPENEHYERMNGLGAGFASISLRSFARARDRKNPVPPTNFWEAVAGILNVPLQAVTVTHLIVLKSLLRHCSEHFIQFYDVAAIALMRKALVQWPTTLPPAIQKTPQCDALKLLPETLAKDENLSLT